MAAIFSLFKAISEINSLSGYAMQIGAMITEWYIQKQTSDTLAEIANVAALSARSKTDEERYAAAQKWHDVLSRDRYS